MMIFVLTVGLLIIFSVSALSRLPYFKRKWGPHKWGIVVAEDGFELTKNQEVLESIAFCDVARLEVYKEDQITVDLICCDILLGTGEGGRSWTVNEDISGFKELMQSFAKLPGFNTEWSAAIVKPAFHENRTVIFDRASGADFRPAWQVDQPCDKPAGELQ